MPHINRIRLVNVNFNDAKGIYDDFSMQMGGKSTTYDLMNTGGKSLLLLMLLQTVIPNTYLKKEKPIKNIFIGGNTKRTSHCAVEWILDDGYEYKYMLTGFCARKRQEIESEQTENRLEIDYFNYCIFYNGDNKSDIKHLPLSIKENNEKTYMSYDKLRQLLNNLKKEGEPVEIFDSKKDYQKYIEYYGLIAAEWKLISEINVSENYIEKYFKENKTSRKLIENFLIKIIDNVNDYDDTLADTLIELKDNLMEFRKKSDNKNEFVQAKELYENLNKKSDELLNVYTNVENLNRKAYEAYVYKKEEITNLKEKISTQNAKISELEEAKKQIECENKKLKIDELYSILDGKEKEKNECEEIKLKTENEAQKAKEKLQLAKAQNEYVDYLENKAKVEETQIRIENLSKQKDEKKYQIYGYNYKKLLTEKIASMQGEIEKNKALETEKNEARKIAKKAQADAQVVFAKSENKLEEIARIIKEQNEEINHLSYTLTSQGKMEMLLNLEQAILQNEEDINNLEQIQKQREEEKENINNNIIQNKIEISKIQADQTILQNQKQEAEKVKQEYEAKKKSIERLVKTFESENLQETLTNELQIQEKERSTKQIERQKRQRKLELINKYNILVPNEEIFSLKEKLENKCSYVTTGIEKIMEKSEDERSQILSQNPLYIYTVFVDEVSFQKIKNKQIEIETENLVPIASIQLLRNNYEYKTEEILFPINPKVYTTNLEEYKVSLEKEIALLDHKIETIRKKEEEIKTYLSEVNSYLEYYTNEVVSGIYKNIEDIVNQISSKETKLNSIHNEIENCKEKIEEIIAQTEAFMLKLNDLQKEKELLNLLKVKQEELNKTKQKQVALQKEYEVAKEILAEKTEIYNAIEDELQYIKGKIQTAEIQKEELTKQIAELPEFQETQLVEEKFEQVKNTYEALSKSHSDLNDLEQLYKAYKSAMDKSENSIKENNYTIEHFSGKTFEKLGGYQIDELKRNKEVQEAALKNAEQKLQEKLDECKETQNRISFLKETTEYIFENRIREISKIHEKLSYNEILLKQKEKEVKEIHKTIKDVEDRIQNLEKENYGLDLFVIEKKIKPVEVNISALLVSEIYSYQKIKTESTKLEREIEKCQNQFSRYIQQIKTATSQFYIKQDVEEQLQNIKQPANLEECTQINKGIGIIIEQLEEKIRHIDEALRNLEEYQNHFITKCYEKAETIVKDLEKLPGLSRIKIGGKDVNIIKLDLYEYEKDEKIKRMKEYIYKIVRQMEEEPESLSKEVLNEKLSSKSLVAQIANLDKASVKLYKIEDIQEHSTYKKWEEDLGSDGQVNAIYFMFAVCIISYISMLTRKEGSSKSKKVIIVDNPFGATSAVFLWNVMFGILKENNVQLIAPGHNINKEIISKFEVNYVLKHEYYNGNRKSVVVDKELRTEDSLENMDFAVIEGSQQSMF